MSIPVYPSQGAPVPPSRSVAIDWLRAASVLYIVGFWHMVDYLPGIDHRNALTVRITVVLLATFVLISGYLIGRQDIPLTRDGLTRFYLRRFGRVFPPFLAALLLFWLFGINDAVTLAKAGLLVSMLWGPAPLTLWFIAMICLFYVATPVLLATRGSGRIFIGMTLLTSIVLVAVCLVSYRVDDRLGMYFPVYCTGLWLARPGLRLPRVDAWLVLLFVLALALSFQGNSKTLDVELVALPLALGGAVLLFVAAMQFERWLPAWRAIGVLSFAGYFLYLFHRPVYMGFAGLLAGQPAGVFVAGFLLLAIPAAILIAWAGQRLYDWLWTTYVVPARAS